MPGAAELRTLRRRIRSVKSTQKITRSFELIAASRISKARGAVESARPYAAGVTRVIRDLAAQGGLGEHPVLQQRADVKRVAVVVVTSDRGLAGAYNTNVLRRAERLLKEERDAGRDVELHAVGKKAEGYFRYRRTVPTAAYEGITDRPRYVDAVGVARPIVERFGAGDLDRVWLVYTDFKSALTQTPNAVQILPVRTEGLRGGEGFGAEFLFEPSPEDILAALLPKYVEHQVFAGMLESAASEHASRQRAMKAATDNAGDVIEDLTRRANQARQAAITTEISEIVGGAEALSQEV